MCLVICTGGCRLRNRLKSDHQRGTKNDSAHRRLSCVVVESVASVILVENQIESFVTGLSVPGAYCVPLTNCQTQMKCILYRLFLLLYINIILSILPVRGVVQNSIPPYPRYIEIICPSSMRTTTGELFALLAEHV